MANLVYKRLFKLALAALLAGCASEPVPHQVEYPKNTQQQSKIPPARYPVKSAHPTISKELWEIAVFKQLWVVRINRNICQFICGTRLYPAHGT